MEIMRVGNLEEAIKLATRLKQEGKYDWFRGQRKNWRLQSTFLRLDESQIERARRNTAEYERWVQRTPGLEMLAANPDQAIAVAQHYGLPTNFIDFTADPKVAGFFAATPPEASSDDNRESCILCLDTKDLAEFLEAMPEPNKHIEFLRLTIPNLWRLEAQAGAFLFCPYADYEQFYDFDRIIFEAGPFSLAQPAVGYYPIRKSALEILLAQFLMDLQLIEGTERVDKMFKGIDRVEIATPETRCDPDLIIGGDMPCHSSWAAAALKPWLAVSEETLHAAQSKEQIPLDLNLDLQANEAGQALVDLVRQKLQADPLVRSKLLEFKYELTYSTVPVGPILELLKTLSHLWDGLRLFPYTDAELAQALGNCYALLLWQTKYGFPRAEEFNKVTDACWGATQEVSFGAPDGSYATAWVSQQALLTCVRPDIEKFLAPKYKDHVLGHSTGLLQACSDPRKLFDFRLLAGLFATQLAPVQLLTRGRKAIFYSPARLNTFRLP